MYLAVCNVLYKKATTDDGIEDNELGPEVTDDDNSTVTFVYGFGEKEEISDDIETAVSHVRQDVGKFRKSPNSKEC